jgi:cytoskeletal protein CcmA (bactofilin family)
MVRSRVLSVDFPDGTQIRRNFSEASGLCCVLAMDRLTCKPSWDLAKLNARLLASCHEDEQRQIAGRSSSATTSKRTGEAGAGLVHCRQSPTNLATSTWQGEGQVACPKHEIAWLFFEGPVRIDGHVDGEIRANDCLVIGEGAIVTALLRVASVVIAGKVSGDIQASRRIEIRPTARVFGNLTTPVLVMHDGALFQGHCTMHAEAKEDRKVTPIAAREERVVQQPAVASNNKLA